MHPHLHTKNNTGCEEVMTAFEACHARGFLWKSMGKCNGLKDQLTQCLLQERARIQAANRAQAQERMAKVREQWKEMAENS